MRGAASVPRAKVLRLQNRKPHRTFSHEECNRFRKRCTNLTDSFEEKGQCPDREVLSVKDELIAPSSRLVSLFSTG